MACPIGIDDHAAHVEVESMVSSSGDADGSDKEFPGQGESWNNFAVINQPGSVALPGAITVVEFSSHRWGYLSS